MHVMDRIKILLEKDKHSSMLHYLGIARTWFGELGAMTPGHLNLGKISQEVPTYKHRRLE